MQEKIILIDEKMNNYEILKLIGELLVSLRLAKKIKSILAILAVFAIFYLLVNLDLQSILVNLKSHFIAESIRNMKISDEWVKKYGIVLNNKMLMTDDADKDGLNFVYEQKYNTHPYNSDTDGDGVSDGDEINQGTNPLGAGDLDNDQDKLPDNWETEYGLSADLIDAMEDPDKDGLINLDEYVHGTNPQKSDTDGDQYDDLSEIKNGYDPDAPGEARPKITILIEKINVAAPVIWSSSDEEKSFQKDLEKGVINYPQSGVPGQTGNTIIAGHSSNYAWAKGEYNSIFRDLNKLEIGDKVLIRSVQQNGKTFEYAYEITEKRIVARDNEWIFESSQNAKWLTISTCWPVGTDLSRLVIRAEMI